MNLETEWVQYDVAGQGVRGYLTRPAAARRAPLPGVLVIQEAFGVDGHIQDVAERFAMAGYAAFAPDLFSYGGTPTALSSVRIEAVKAFLDTVPQAAWFDPALRAPALAKLPGNEGAEVEETLSRILTQNRPWEQYVATLRAGHAWLSANAARGHTVGSVGFCMGGALSLRLACAEPALAAAVVFYGFPPPHEQLAGLRCPVLGLYAEHDEKITGALPALADAMRAGGKHFEHHVYAGARHAFLNDTRGNYAPGPSRDAWARTLAFLAQHVR
jgi:carboxymethylenebutenolidase